MKNFLDSYSKPTRALIVRALCFALLFSVLASIIGTKIMNYNLFFTSGFEVYGVLGKTLLFSIIVFGLLVRKTKLPKSVPPWNRLNILWVMLSVFATFLALFFINVLNANNDNLTFIVFTHLAVLCSSSFALLGCFGFPTLSMLYKVYYRELLTSIAIGVAFLGFLELVYASWEFFATIVLNGVRALLELSGVFVVFIEPYTLLMDKLAITIEKGCSGIESIALFTGLYVVVGVLDWKLLNHRKVIGLFPIALVALIIFNILRVYLLVLGGYFINKEIALTLFHTYAGMLFFILFSAVFWKLSYTWLIDNTKARR